MLRAKLVGSLGLVLSGAALAFAQEPPPLQAPAIEPDTPKASAPPTQTPATPPNPGVPAAPANSPPSAASQVRPMLVIPGVTTPVRRPGATTKATAPQSPRAAAEAGTSRREAGPAVAGPSEVGSPFRPRTGQSQTSAQPGRRTPAADSDDARAARRRAEHKPQGREAGSTCDARTISRGGARPAQEALNETPVDDRPVTSRDARPAPRRLPGLLGRIFPPPPAPAARADSRKTESQVRKKGETPAEPVTDASVKRKIEKQIRDTLGDRVRSVEVRVSGRNVLIVAQATRFWQKRTVRRSLETLPGLDGYRARVELDD